MKIAIKRWLLISLFGAGMANGGLVSYYTFDETSGGTATDSGPAGADGAIGSNVTLGTPGKFGTAFTFNNDASQNGIVDMGDAADLFSAITASKAVTVSVWLKWTASEVRDSAVFLGDNTTSNRYLDIGTASGTSGVYARVRDGVNTGYPDLMPAPASPLNNGEWHHVAFTADATTEVVQLYIDGVAVATSSTNAFEFPSVFNNFEIGRLGRSSPTDAYAGSVDELRIYDNVLSAVEIEDLARGPLGDPSLKIASSFSATTARDTTILSIPFSNGGTTKTLTLPGSKPISISGSNAANFTVSSYDNNLAPGASGVIRIEFTPSGTGFHTALLTIGSNDALQTFRQVSLSVEVADPIASVSPAAIDFGGFAAGAGPQTRTLTISNNGGAAGLTVFSVAVTGSGAFSTNVTDVFVVAPDSSAEIPVTFNAGTAEGGFSANLEITTDGYNQTSFVVPLSAEVTLNNPEASLVSHFTFDDQSALGDDVGSFDNDGTPMGAAQWSSFSRVGAGSLLLDGSSLIDLGVASGPDYAAGILSDNDGFSVACWAHVPEGATADRTRFFSAYANGSAALTEGWGVGQRNTGRQMVGTTYGKADYLTPANTVPAAGAWHHYAYVFRGSPVSRVDFYIDGALVDSRTSTVTGANDATTVGFAIGALGRSTAFEGFQGHLDDLRIYSRELTGGNISDLYQSAPQASGYAAWAASFGLDPAGNGGYLEDPDGDGVRNSIEYLLGSSPVAGVSDHLPAGAKTGNDLVIVYQRKTAAIAVGFVDRVEFSSNLAEDGWTPAVDGADGVTVRAVATDAETEEVTVTIPASGPRMFARLTVAAP